MSTSYDNVPAALRAVPRWVCWRFVKGSKVPWNGRHAVSPHDPAQWMTFADAVAMSQRVGGGIGIVFNGDGLGVVDLDACRCRKTGRVATWAWRVLVAFKAKGAYVELSPSGMGFHIISAGAPARLSRTERKHTPTPGIDTGGKAPLLEAFVDRRFVTITGRAASGDVIDCSAEWDRVVAYIGASTAPPTAMAEPLDVSLEVVRDALSVLSSDEVGRSMFVAFGQALKHQFGEEARSTWLEWMSRSVHDDPDVSERLWESLGTPDHITVRSILWHARKKGWQGYLDFEFEPEQLTPEDIERAMQEVRL